MGKCFSHTLLGDEAFPRHHGNAAHAQKASMSNHSDSQKSVKTIKNKSGNSLLEGQLHSGGGNAPQN